LPIASSALTLAIVVALGLAATQSAQAQTFTVLHKFTGPPDGANPYAGLLRNAAGNLYSTTYEGGDGTGCENYGCGTVFRMDTSGEETVLYSFTGGTDGGRPLANLIMDAAGNLYGTTSSGGTENCDPSCGTVYELKKNGGLTVLHSFAGFQSDGCEPYAGLLRDKAGNLYGTTLGCGAYSFGTVFRVDTTGTETVLYNFTGGRDGGGPSAGLISDKSGNLYGTTFDGGAYEYGVVFKLTPSSGGWKESVLYSFAGGANGGYTDAGLIFDKAGNLYGSTLRGGAYDAGMVFKLSPSTKGAWNIRVLYSFTGNNDGGSPRASVIFDKSGNLYGTTQVGGYYQYGTVFELKPTHKGQWKESVLWDFTGGADGANPYAGLIEDGDGNLYGTALNGGDLKCDGGCGTVWKLTP